MLYALLGSLLTGGLATLYVLWRKAQLETQLKSAQKDLVAARKEIEDWRQSLETLKGEYNSLVEHANAQIAQLQKDRDELEDALKNSGKPGVFADLLRARNAKA